MSHNIGTVILATTDDIQFLYKLIDQCLLFSSQIVISFGSHFYNKESENEDLIKKLETFYNDNNNVSIIRYNLETDFIEYVYVNKDHYWHCHGRWIGINNLKDEIEYVLLLDADEIPEGNVFLNWLNTKDYINYDCLKLANYWYFREPIFRAINLIEDSIVFIKKEHADNIDLIMHSYERAGTYDNCPGKKTKFVTFNNSPMFHHYSWVRTKEQMLRKVKSWGHKNDKDYVFLVNEEFSHNFNFSENIIGRTYEIVENVFHISINDNK
jgi:hypothetical protein